MGGKEGDREVGSDKESTRTGITCGPAEQRIKHVG